MMISEWTLWSYHGFCLKDVCVALPVLGLLVLASLLGLGENVVVRLVLLLDLGKDVVVRLVLLLDLGKDVVVRLVLLLDLGEDVEDSGKDMVVRQDLVGLVSACYPLVAWDV
jgi:hypothetical protein